MDQPMQPPSYSDTGLALAPGKGYEQMTQGMYTEESGVYANQDMRHGIVHPTRQHEVYANYQSSNSAVNSDRTSHNVVDSSKIGFPVNHGQDQAHQRNHTSTTTNCTSYVSNPAVGSAKAKAPPSAHQDMQTAGGTPMLTRFENFADKWTPYPSFANMFKLIAQLNLLMHDILMKEDFTFSATWLHSAGIFQFICEDLFLVSSSSVIALKSIPTIPDELCCASAILEFIREVKVNERDYLMHQYCMTAIRLFDHVKSFAAETLKNQQPYMNSPALQASMRAVPYAYARTGTEYCGSKGPTVGVTPGYSAIYSHPGMKITNTQSGNVAKHQTMSYIQAPGYQNNMVYTTYNRSPVYTQQSRCSCGCGRPIRFIQPRPVDKTFVPVPQQFSTTGEVFPVYLPLTPVYMTAPNNSQAAWCTINTADATGQYHSDPRMYPQVSTGHPNWPQYRYYTNVPSGQL